MKLNPAILSDIHMTTEGEPEIAGNGDFKIVQSTDAYLESIFFRLQTVAGDFLLEPECGASLEQAIGEPNSPETATLVESLITRALTHDGFLSQSQLKIQVIPLDYNLLGAFVTAYIDGESTTLAVSLDLKEGQIQLTRV